MKIITNPSFSDTYTIVFKKEVYLGQDLKKPEVYLDTLIILSLLLRILRRMHTQQILFILLWAKNLKKFIFMKNLYRLSIDVKFYENSDFVIIFQNLNIFIQF